MELWVCRIVSINTKTKLSESNPTERGVEAFTIKKRASLNVYLAKSREEVKNQVNANLKNAEKGIRRGKDLIAGFNLPAVGSSTLCVEINN